MCTEGLAQLLDVNQKAGPVLPSGQSKNVDIICNT